MDDVSRLRGVNLGGWLLMEGYILHGRNIGETALKDAFECRNGADERAAFEKAYRDTFIQEEDIRNIASLGATVIRVPFNHKLLEKKPYTFNEDGFEYLRSVLLWADRYGLKVILDLHAAPGAQNYDWHSDSTGEALFWDEQDNRERALCLWEAIADRCKDNPAVAGYDILNEPVLGGRDVAVLKDFYRKSIRRIRAIDPGHTLYIEGSNWAQQVDFLADLLDTNVAVSIHTYAPLSYTFNFQPFQTYPGTIEGEYWDENRVRRYLEPYRDFARKHGVRVFVGEFGINGRGGHYGEDAWLESMLRTFNEFDFDYTYWTYKAVANSVFPDGIYRYIPNPKYVRREGPVYGFENYIDCWRSEKDEIVDFWKTARYTPEERFVKLLRKYFAK